MSWPEIALGEIAEFRNGLNYTKDNEGAGLRVINVKDFGSRSLPNYDELGELNPHGILRDEALLKHGDIIFVRSNGNKDLVGRSLFIANPPDHVSFSAFCIRARLSDSANPRFYAYFFRTPHFRKRLALLGKGTNISNLNQGVLSRITVPNPPKKQQSSVVAAISTYDDLIQNNRRRIQLLEQAARLLYKEWFVHLRFPGHEHVKIKDGVPEGWEKKPLGEVALLNYGKALKKDDRLPGPFPVYGSSGVVGTHVKALVPGPSIIVGRKGNVGSVFWSSEDCHPIDTVYYIDTSRCSFHLYYSLQHMSFISTDVAVPGLNRDFAHSRSVLVPERKLFRMFEETVMPLHQQIDVLRKAIAALEKTRDLLLPRLMNGEIDVSEINIGIGGTI